MQSSVNLYSFEERKRDEDLYEMQGREGRE